MRVAPFVDATVIVVDQGPFDRNWMFTWNGDPDPLTVKLGPDSQGNYEDFTVLDCAIPLAGAGDRYLIVQGDATAYAKNYQIDGARKRRHMARAGEWAASPAVSSTTTGAVSSTFDLRPGTPTGTSTERTRVALTPNLVGWVLQPDINKQVFAPITAVDAVNCSVTVGVDLASLAGVGKRWRIHAPPGSVTFGPGGGTSADFDFGQVYVSANSTRHLFAGYRYESPLAGARELLTPIGSFAASGRQSGKNFTGQYYTLWRHYDPALMRFTGPDPAAQFHYNLFGYSKNAPGRYTDPDGDIIFLLPALGLAAAAGIGFDYAVHNVSNAITGNKQEYTLMDAVHGGLDGMGMIPFIGAAFDGMNAAVYAGQAIFGDPNDRAKNWAMAGVSAFSMIPGIGDLVGAATMFGGKQAIKQGVKEVTGQVAEAATKQADNVAKAAPAPSSAPAQVPTKTVGDPGTYSKVKIENGAVYTPKPSKGGSGPLRWTRTNRQATTLSDRPTAFYQVVKEKTGELLKWGITSNPAKRYSQKWLRKHNAKLDVIAEGPRREMLRLERNHVGMIPGRLNREKFAGTYWSRQ